MAKSLFRPGQAEKADEAHHIISIGAAGVNTLAAMDPAFEDALNGLIELFHPALDVRGARALEQRRYRRAGRAWKRDGEAGGHRLRKKFKGVVHGV